MKSTYTNASMPPLHSDLQVRRLLMATDSHLANQPKKHLTKRHEVVPRKIQYERQLVYNQQSDQQERWPYTADVMLVRVICKQPTTTLHNLLLLLEGAKCSCKARLGALTQALTTLMVLSNTCLVGMEIDPVMH